MVSFSSQDVLWGYVPRYSSYSILSGGVPPNLAIYLATCPIILRSFSNIGHLLRSIHSFET